MNAIDRPGCNVTRRRFLKTALGAGLASGVHADTFAASDSGELGRIMGEPVLNVSFLREPITVASVELLRNGDVFLVRVRSTAGVEAITVPNPARMAFMYPLFLRQIAPFFVGKDAR